MNAAAERSLRLFEVGSHVMLPPVIYRDMNICGAMPGSSLGGVNIIIWRGPRALAELGSLHQFLNHMGAKNLPTRAGHAWIFDSRVTVVFGSLSSYRFYMLSGER